MEKMKLPSGVVLIFGLLNNDEKDIHVYFDKEITKEPRMIFHPNVNIKPIFLGTNNIFYYWKIFTLTTLLWIFNF